MNMQICLRRTPTDCGRAFFIKEHTFSCVVQIDKLQASHETGTFIHVCGTDGQIAGEAEDRNMYPDLWSHVNEATAPAIRPEFPGPHQEQS